MEHIHGGTLTDIIKRCVEVGRFLPLEHALHIVGQVAAGLDYAHRRRDPLGEAQGIVHGDVSLSNIMVNYKGQAKLIAFGSALVRAQIPGESQIHPAQARYMSPEKVAGEVIDHRSDIYSLGIALYETTVAQPLCRGSTEEILKRIISEPIRPPTSVRRDYPRALEAIVMKALERRPADRYQSADHLRSDLEDFVNVAGIRSGAQRVAVYLRDLFPMTALYSDDGIANEGMRGSTSTAVLRPSSRRGPSRLRRVIIGAIPALAALTAFAFFSRPSGRNDAPAAFLSAGATSVRRQGQAVVPLQTAFVSHSQQPAKPPAMLVVQMPPPAAAQRATVGSDTARTQRPRRRGIAAGVSAPADFLTEAPLVSPRVAPPAPKHLQTQPHESLVARSDTRAATLPPARAPGPPVPASPPSGVVDSRAVAAVVRAHAIEVQGCFDRALMEQPSLRGRLSVRATIDADGRVLDISQFGPALAGGGRLQECAMRTFQRWIFPPPRGGGKGSITYTLRFE